MANLLIRNLNDEVLKAAAKANGRSLQAEIRDALYRASIRSLAETRRLSALWIRRLSQSPCSSNAALDTLRADIAEGFDGSKARSASTVLGRLERKYARMARDRKRRVK